MQQPEYKENEMNKRNIVIVSIASVAALAIVGVGAGVALSTQTSAPSTTSVAETTPSVAPSSDPATNSEPATSPAADAVVGARTLAENLAYIIEEEKLAYDVYTVLGDLWGSRTMSNITNSETSHQAQVATLLGAYGIADPRSTEVGVFTNPDLQALYDSLIAQGSASEKAAMEVGVLIEEKDIADIDVMISQTTEPDVIAVLESLLAGSVNHLAAFQRQLA
jgi:hypothetical protein